LFILNSSLKDYLHNRPKSGDFGQRWELLQSMSLVTYFPDVHHKKLTILSVTS